MMTNKKTIIEINKLTTKYGEKTVLNNISTEIYSSEICVILGTSGCGKTTLLKNIIGLLRPFSGSVKIFDTPIGELDSEETVEILKKIGILFQNGALLGSLTSGENIALPLKMHTTLPDDIINEIVHLKLVQVDLPHAANLYPSELSGGMRKRVAMARALALDPPILFCDEPSAGLDPVTSNGLDDLLLKIRESLGITIVVITHELLSIKKIADRIIFLHRGKLLYDGLFQDAQAFDEGPVFDFFNRTPQPIYPNNTTEETPFFNVEYK
ncbi:MAG: ATP-binding cassette domain-containing protein [Chitinispirillia bacterium]|jgi:phospholipid/cholesterol/gamma-HCH transport system ATP-binding protein